MATLGFAAAARRDSVALEILRAAAAELAAMAVVTARRLELQSGLVLALTGSVLIQNSEFRQQVVDGIAAAEVKLAGSMVVEDAVAGAVNIARGLAGAASR
jgi:N-acetylglucosamine kinase-like BadF-type ATPase